MERMRENGPHILRKRNVSKKWKYKKKTAKCRDYEEQLKESKNECGENEERKVLKARRRKKIRQDNGEENKKGEKTNNKG